MNRVAAAALSAVLTASAACGDATGSGAGFKRLYVADQTVAGVLGYPLPLSAGSMPSDTIKGVGTPWGVAFDRSGNLAVCAAHTLYLLHAPFTSASVPHDSVTVAGPLCGFIADGPDKKLYGPTSADSPRG